MEFISTSRYFDFENSTILKFDSLKVLKPLRVNQNLEIIECEENKDIIEKVISEQLQVVPIRRISEDSAYADRIEFPRRVLFEMTSRCNYLCKMCPQNNLKRPKMDMDKSVYMRVLDELDQHGIEGIWLYHLGESILHPDFKEIIERVKQKKNLGMIWMSTNGELFTDEYAKTVLNSNIDFINYSMHAVSAEVYHKVTSKDFEVVHNNLYHLYELKKMLGLKKPFIHCQMIDQAETHHEIDAFIKEHYDKADIVSINMLEYANLPNNAYGLSARTRDPLKSCTRVSRNDCFICSNGAVTLCDAAYNGEIDLGNINEMTLFEIWNGEKRLEILEKNKCGAMSDYEFCRRCTDYDI